jgi:hypothetical protein
MTRPANRAAMRAMERIGLSLVGQTFWKGGDVVWYAVDRATWQRQRTGTPEYTIVSAPSASQGDSSLRRSSV